MENKILIRKIKCAEQGCGFVADLLPDGRAISDTADPPEEQVELWRNEDGTFECLACGAPIRVEKEEE